MEDQAKLEERIAHLERTTDDLSAVVAGQAVEIDRLTRKVALLMEREAAREAAEGAAVFGDERPPHY